MHFYLDIGENSSSETLTSTVDTLEDAGISVLRSNIMSDFSSLEEVSSSIPDDQLRMIDNINSLMSEVISFYFHKCGIILIPTRISQLTYLIFGVKAVGLMLMLFRICS
jgi:hypothetical protein